MTPAILRALEVLDDRGQVPQVDASEPSLDQPALGNPITHGQIIAISKNLKELQTSAANDSVDDMVSYHLDDLLRGSKVYIEPPKPKVEPVSSAQLPFPHRYLAVLPTQNKQSSEYKALMARLRREEENRAYERMINPPLLRTETFSQRFPNSSSPVALFPAAQADVGQDNDDDEVSYADINRQMALIINILISIVACSVAIWLAARHWSTPTRLGLSMGGSGMIGVAEVVVYAGYLRRVKEAREKGKKVVEVKEIVKTFVIGGGDEKAVSNEDIPIDEKKTSKDDELRRRKAMSR